MKLKITPVFLVFFLLYLCGCSMMSSNVDLPADLNEQAKIDFAKICVYFSKNKGNIPLEPKQVVRWEDTEIYRVYFLNGYILVQHPIVFDDDEFQITIMDGTLERASDYYNKFIMETRYPNYPYEYIHRSAKNNADYMPNFYGIKLGSSEVDTVEALRNAILVAPNNRREHGSLIGQLNRRAAGQPGLATVGLNWRKFVGVNCEFHDEKLIMMTLYRSKSRRTGGVGSYSIIVEKVNNIAGGSFTIP